MTSTEDLTLNLLAHQAFPRLAAAVRARAASIIPKWEIAVRNTLPAADELTLLQLRNSLPLVLDEIADALASDKPHATYALIEGSKSHGATRFHENYNVQELIIEYRLLRRIIVEQVSQALDGKVDVQGQVALNMAVDTALQHGVVEFTEHLQQRLQASTDAQAKYLSFLSHDLRNHLNHAMLHLQLLAAKLAKAPEYAESMEDIQSIKRAILQTTTGMDRLLQAELLRQECVELHVYPVDLHRLILEVSKQLLQEAQSKGLEFEVDVPDGAHAESDGALLTLVLQNLLANAVKYSSRGRVTIKASNMADSYWVLSVIDQGPGIPPENLKNLFDAFRRGETYGQSGVGLGLCIASHATRLLGGELEIESAINVGSTFRLVLPNRNPSST
ncbi:MAG: sensor histidine kinase [Nitrosospira sp.]|nr:sensor histidine kinase [Nitrosospira sp.]